VDVRLQIATNVYSMLKNKVFSRCLLQNVIEAHVTIQPILNLLSEKAEEDNMSEVEK
jgi:hypothetical protein